MGDGFCVDLNGGERQREKVVVRMDAETSTIHIFIEMNVEFLFGGN